MMVFATDVGSLNWLKTIKIFYVLHKCDYLWGDPDYTVKELSPPRKPRTTQMEDGDNE